MARFFDLQAGEAPRAWLLFGYLFALIAFVIVVKVVRNAVFLTTVGVEGLPIAYIAVAFGATTFMLLYNRIARYWSLLRMIRTLTALILLSCLAIWYVLIKGHSGALFQYAFYVWASVVGVVLTSQFWLLANEVFDARQAKRTFSLIGIGGILGGIAAGYLTSLAVPVIGTSGMLIFAAGLLLACLLLTLALARILRERGRSSEEGSSNLTNQVLKSPYLRNIALLVACSVLMAGLVDYQYNAIAVRYYPEADGLTSFLAFWLSTLSTVSLVIQTFLTRPIIKWMGVSRTLFVTPFFIGVASALAAFFPVLGPAIALKVGEGSLKQSLNKTGMELLMLPVPTRLRSVAKTFIDVFVDSLASGLNGLILLVTISLLALPVVYLNGLIALLAVAAVVLIFFIRGEYLDYFRTAIQRRSLQFTADTINQQDDAMMESLAQVLQGDNDRQIVYILGLLDRVEHPTVLAALLPLISHDQEHVCIAALRLYPQYDEQVAQACRAYLADGSYELRCEAIQYLAINDVQAGDVIDQALGGDDLSLAAAAFSGLYTGRQVRTDLMQRFPLGSLLERLDPALSKESAGDEGRTLLKRSAIDAITMTHSRAHYGLIETLANDDAIAVRLRAVRCLALTGDVAFMPLIVEKLSDKPVRAAAREALSTLEQSVIDDVFKRYWAGEVHPRDMAAILARRNDSLAVDSLLQMLDRERDWHYYEPLKALNKIRRRNPHLKVDSTTNAALMRDYAARYVGIRMSRYRFAEGEKPGQALALLLRSLDEKSEFYLRVLFRILALRYEPVGIYDAYLAIVSDNKRWRGDAIEYLDNTLVKNDRTLMMNLLETGSVYSLAYRLKGELSLQIPSYDQAVRRLLASVDPWLVACCANFLAEEGAATFSAELEPLVSHDDEVVRETVTLALKKT